MSDYTALDIAHWFINKEDMTPKKVQKLVYYAYSWFLVYFNETEDDIEFELFDNNIEAWVHGPVVDEIYQKYKEYGYNPIKKKYEGLEIEEETEEVLEEVWKKYGHLSADELERLTHKELPWKRARKGLGPLDYTNKRINKKVIFNYYGDQLV